MNIGADFNRFKFRKAGVHFLQNFIIGYLTIGSLLFLWSATSDYGLERTINDISLGLLLSPLFWFLPFMVAIIVAVLRGIESEDIDPTDPKQLDEYFERREFKNQPIWFKALAGCFAALVAYAMLAPDKEISKHRYERMEDELSRASVPELNAFYDEIYSDGKIVRSEFRDFMNLSLQLQLGNRKTEGWK